MNLRERKRYNDKTKSQYWHGAMQSAHMERALTDNPAFLRLTDLAVAFAGANGHAEFAHGELTKFLGKDYRTVDKAIAEAVAYGLLAEGSHKRCLRIPRELYSTYAGRGSKADQDARRVEPCPTCTGVPRNPASCHPDRPRYTSVENGGWCESCYRNRNRKTT